MHLVILERNNSHAPRILSRKSWKISMSLRMSGEYDERNYKKCLWPITEISLIEKINDIVNPQFSSKKKKVCLWQMPQKRSLIYGYYKDLMTGGIWPGQGGWEPLRKWPLSSDVGEGQSLTSQEGKETSLGHGKHVQGPCHRRKHNEHKNLREGQCEEQWEREAGQEAGRSWARSMLRISFILKSDLHLRSLWLQCRWIGGGQRDSRWLPLRWLQH